MLTIAGGILLALFILALIVTYVPLLIKAVLFAFMGSMLGFEWVTTRLTRVFSIRLW